MGWSRDQCRTPSFHLKEESVVMDESPQDSRRHCPRSLQKPVGNAHGPATLAPLLLLQTPGSQKQNG